ncbi:hypothetical protein BDM02DRAFT_3127647 [Thelephora ganbajun]|uniref:Uncharacterized protein n=1 Tax=Thelephora ganbajun TaxID=370292 RepID=A0ACB6ZM54_THEGA|nr:hypothetical protein BDM02DRAFT_3127647 [Thelephora ganbajun]
MGLEGRASEPPEVLELAKDTKAGGPHMHARVPVGPLVLFENHDPTVWHQDCVIILVQPCVLRSVLWIPNVTRNTTNFQLLPAEASRRSWYLDWTRGDEQDLISRVRMTSFLVISCYFLFSSEIAPSLALGTSNGRERGIRPPDASVPFAPNPHGIQPIVKSTSVSPALSGPFSSVSLLWKIATPTPTNEGHRFTPLRIFEAYLGQCRPGWNMCTDTAFDQHSAKKIPAFGRPNSHPRPLADGWYTEQATEGEFGRGNLEDWKRSRCFLFQLGIGPEGSASRGKICGLGGSLVMVGGGEYPGRRGFQTPIMLLLSGSSFEGNKETHSLRLFLVPRAQAAGDTCMRRIIPGDLASALGNFVLARELEVVDRSEFVHEDGKERISLGVKTGASNAYTTTDKLVQELDLTM